MTDPMADQITNAKRFTAAYYNRLDMMSEDDAAMVRRCVARKLRRAFKRSKAHRAFRKAREARSV